LSYWKLGCRWGSKTEGIPLFYDLLTKYNIVIGWENKDYRVGASVLLTDGHTALGVAKTTGPRKSVLDFPHYKQEFVDLEIDYSEHLYLYDANILTLTERERFEFQTQVGICRINKQDIRAKIDNIFSANEPRLMENVIKNNYLDLLKYKKQIILQGPPGTGKTRLAKQLANELALFPLDRVITIEDIISVLVANLDISTPTGYNTFKIVKHNKDSLTIYPRDAKNPYNIPYRDIIQSAKFYKQPGQDKASDIGGVKSYIISLANYVVESLVSSQIQLLQFHPSYSYEDFVRGIIAESQGDRIEYKNVNKILGLFAKNANDNYELSKKDNKGIQQDKWIEESFNDFKEEIENEIEQNELILSNDITVFKVENDCFRYGKQWATPSRINFDDFKNTIKAVLKESVDLTQNTIPKEVSVHGHFRFTYYLALLRIFFHKYKFEITSEKQVLKSYVLIIDEINRANLSSVLGELIYALEYRGEKVESMYAVDGKPQLVLPPNLYIIGTMNTADRSVGHIDYAIRRRFAFVDVLPKDLSLEMGDKFNKPLFEQVANLFITNLSPEFEIKDVQLGHSYFIDKTNEGGSMQLRLQYEIKPILIEYVKDGILIGEGIMDTITKLSV
jgi:5-methylcytosine-specific restriction protein B